MSPTALPCHLHGRESADLSKLQRMRDDRPWVMTNLKTGEGLDHIERFIIERGVLATARA
jgi:urease accessory protein